MSSSRSGKNAPPRAWQRMLSGRRLDLLDPSPLDIELEDIALGLSCVARWNGQTEGDWPFSVAQHCIVVEKLVRELMPDVPPKMRLAALLHDAPEYVIGDMISPFKGAIGDSYKKLENRLQEAIHVRFGLPARLPTGWSGIIKKADLVSAYLEAVHLAGFSEEEAGALWKVKVPRMDTTELIPLNPKRARTEYINYFNYLYDISLKSV